MQFHELALVFEQLEQTASRLTITEILAALFTKTRGDEIGKICYLLQGRVVPQYEPIEFGVADKFMMRAIAKGLGIDVANIEKSFREEGDLGSAAQPFSKEKDSSLSVAEVYDALYKIAETSGEGSQERKIEILGATLQKADGLSVRYIVRITLGKLRLGFSSMTILDALSWMVTGDKTLRNSLEDAYNVRPDIGYIAQTVKAHGETGLSRIQAVVGAPILPALCQRIPTATEMIAKMGTVSVEPKYDGVRVEIHFERSDNGQSVTVNTYSRNLENTTAMFPELTEIGNQVKANSVILDSEAVGIDPVTGKVLPFQETTTRKRKHGIQLALETVPLRFYVFDILYKDGRELLQVPLSERRKILLETIGEGSLLTVSPSHVTDNAEEIRQYHEEQRKKGLEGVVVKKWDGLYEPGRKGYSWVKLKEEEGKTGKLTDTIDAVVMGYYRGEGKRTAFGIGALLVGVRQGETFVTVTKIGTGVSDEMWKDLFTQFTPLQTETAPKEYEAVDKALRPDVWLVPSMVIEIAGDDLTKSPNHGAKYAVRFPRLVRIRDDKSPTEATTVAEIQDMYDAQA